MDYEDSQPGLGGNGLQKHYHYSAASSGRKDLERVEHKFYVNLPSSSTDYTVDYYTDSVYGRPKGIRYPGGVGVAFIYNGGGYLTQEKDASSSYVIRQVQARDSRNQVIAATLANHALTHTAEYYDASGQMKAITVTGPSGSVHDLDYEYDVYGNLNYQQTIVNGATSTEGFIYDTLHRLTMSSRSFPSGTETVNYAYDPSGNLTLKDDYAASYTYNPVSKPNAVASITKIAALGGGTVNFGYDANGNLTSGDGKTLGYNAFNKPTTIIAGGLTATFHYGADLSRYQQEKTNGETVLYIDKLMEIVTVGSTSDYRHYLGESAILTKVGDINDPYPVVKFLLRDRLGSVVTITDEAGAVPEARGYDPFGKPRDGDWAEKTPPVLDSATTDRGFTDHEHLDDSRLIHMNGRAYDYQLGRFLSVDPFIQAPGNSQSLNPYSYIMNNPLSGTDPSGYCAVSRIKTVCESTPALWGGSAPNAVWERPAGGGSKTAKDPSQSLATQSNGSSTTQTFDPANNASGATDTVGAQHDESSSGQSHVLRDNGDASPVDEFTGLRLDGLPPGIAELFRNEDFLEAVREGIGDSESLINVRARGPLRAGQPNLPDPNDMFPVGAIIREDDGEYYVDEVEQHVVGGNQMREPNKFLRWIGVSNLGAPVMIEDATAVVIVIPTPYPDPQFDITKYTFSQHDPVFPVITIHKNRAFVTIGNDGPHLIEGSP